MNELYREPSPDNMTAPHTQRIQDILNDLGTDPQCGLSSAEVANRLILHGPNEIREGISRPAWKMLLGQFIEPMILILFAAAGLSVVLGDFTEGVAILAIIFLFGILGFIQEYRAEKAMAALKQLSCPTVRVRRDDTIREVPSRDLVPGDIVLLVDGNIIPADLRLIHCVNFGLMEAPLTGESEHVHKHTEALPTESLPLGDRINMAFMGTSVAHGHGEGVVVATGMHTELGKIADLLHNIETGRTPLQRKLAQVGKHLSLAGLGAALILLLSGIMSGVAFADMLLTSVSLLVAVVPEGLPAIVTVTLALGGRRMLKRHALIRKLPAVETLGSVTIICTDKTGTLTENRMSVTRMHTLHHDITLPSNASDTDESSLSTAPDLIPLLLTATLCNDAKLIHSEPGTPMRMIGDPTETALLVAAQRFGITTSSYADHLPRIMEYAFDPIRRQMSTLHRCIDGDCRLPDFMSSPVLVAIKGSPDGLLSLASHTVDNGRITPLNDTLRHNFMAANEALADEGLRVLGIAFRCLDTLPIATASPSDIETNLVFCGLIGLMDPPREAARAAIARSQSAGIRTIMITGDHPRTAAAIARKLHLAPTGEELGVITGKELALLSDSELSQQIDRISVYARVSPEDKLRIVMALQRHGHIVAMTGDGVNDAPSLRRADIGVAMGIIGTDVAKESSAMVLLDDNYATIVAAVEEGRTIFDNLVRFIKFSFGGNLGKVLVMLLAPLFGIGPIALLPLHLLWLNLLTDGLLGLGLGLEPPESDVMSRPPRKPDAPILGKSAIFHMIWMGLLISGAAILLAYWNPALFCRPERGSEWQTILFSVIGFAQMGQAWGLRSFTNAPFRFASIIPFIALTALTLFLHLSVMYNESLREIFELGELTVCGLAASVGVGLLVYAVVRLARRSHLASA